MHRQQKHFLICAHTGAQASKATLTVALQPKHNFLCTVLQAMPIYALDGTDHVKARLAVCTSWESGHEVLTFCFARASSKKATAGFQACCQMPLMHAGVKRQHRCTDAPYCQPRNGGQLVRVRNDAASCVQCTKHFSPHFCSQSYQATLRANLPQALSDAMA